MNYQVEYEERERFVWARFRGALEARDLPVVVEGLLGRRRSEPDRFLIDGSTAELPMRVAQAANAIDRLRALGLLANDCIAVVYRPELEAVADFADLAARNRGWSNLRFFQDVDEAVSWLEAGPPQGSSRPRRAGVPRSDGAEADRRRTA